MTTTLAALDAKAARQEHALDAPRRAARALIAGKVADAHAHAVKAMTAKARNTPDGRQTAAVVRRSPSYQAARNRLVELTDALRSLVADWRETAYRTAFAEWRETLPPEWLGTNTVPRQVDISWARGMALHGLPLITEITAATNDAGRRLWAVVGQAATRALSGRDSLGLIQAWETRTVSALNAVADHLLSDSQVMIDRKVGRDVVKPELLDDDPTLPH